MLLFTLLAFLPLVPVAAWAFWLARRPEATHGMRLMPWLVVLAAPFSVLGLVARAAFNVTQEAPDPADRAAVIGAGTSEALNSAAFFSLVAAALFAIALLVLTLRWRSSRSAR